MKISRAEVAGVALLARLRLSAEEETRLTAELDAILGYMDKLNQLDTAAVEPFSRPSKRSMRFAPTGWPTVPTRKRCSPTRRIATRRFSKFRRSSNESRRADAP